MADVITIRNLTKYYGKQRVVHSLNLNVPKGTVYGFLGRNGAGKSTTIKMLLGLVRPNYGEIKIFGEDAATLKSETRARVAYLAEGHPLYKWMRIGGLVQFARGFQPRWNQELLEKILDHFELSMRKRVGRLSNGQRAQVSLALAVAAEPELLILDDPTLGLDTVVRRDFLESLVQIIQHEGRTIFFSSHILSDVERVADRIAVLDGGVLRADCPTDVFKQSIRKIVLDLKVNGSTLKLPDMQGLINQRQIGGRLELVIANYGEEHRKVCESLDPQSMEVLELNLEEAFIEYTRGPKRSLPIFSGGGQDV
jgi:ABC-2 type transport system ATP-binding protein